MTAVTLYRGGPPMGQDGPQSMGIPESSWMAAMISLRRTAVGFGTAVLVMAGFVTTGPARAAEAVFTPGSAGLGDPFFPLAGNGGYDVSHYSLSLGYDPQSRRLTGTAVVTATATQNLSRFDLDLRGFDVAGLTVDGRPASFTRDGQELVITPAAGLPDGGRFTVTVRYAGVPQVITDPDGSIEGWVPTDDGAFVVGEPQGSPGWYPVNDNPRDKATFDFTVTVPDGLTVMANGVLASKNSAGGRTTFVWRENMPMAPYLATATLGRFDLTEYAMSNGLPVYIAVDPTLSSAKVLQKLPAIVDFYTSIYGPYPFDAVGAIVDDAKNVGYSLETQTKPVFDRVPSEATLAHELSHMWYGDSVTLTQWPDIWLHEGFATWSEWIWSEKTGRKSAASWFKTLYNTPAQDTAFWTPPPGDPGTPAFLFNGTIYYRGGMTLEALREKIGDDTFFRILQKWAAQNRYGNVTTPEFIDLAERESGQDLANFFDVWLYQDAKPTSW
jgi:aminopeptidase N